MIVYLFVCVITLSVRWVHKLNYYSVFVEKSVDVLYAIYFKIILVLLFLASVCFKF